MAATKDNATSTLEVVTAMNNISRFLAHEQIRDATDLDRCLPATSASDGAPQVDVIAFCASAVLYTAESIFTAVNQVTAVRKAQRQQSPSPYSHRIILVLCGGMGHSTHYMHEAVARHRRYRVLAEEVRGQPEARVLQAIAEDFFDLVATEQHAEAGQELISKQDTRQELLTVLVEDQSTNCGANASMTKDLLASHGVHRPRSIIVAQDPTMCRRTAASFEKLYEADAGTKPQILCWPTFVPQVTMAKDDVVDGVDSDLLARLTFQVDAASGPSLDDLWDMSRFADLIMGEIPRLRDSVDGYGPKGKGFISHVDVPESAEAAWRVLKSCLGNLDRTN